MVIRESSLIQQLDMPPTKTPGAPRGTIKGASSQSVVKFTIRAAPLPSIILHYILENADIIKKLQSDQRARQQGKSVDEEDTEEADAAENYGDVVRKPTVTLDRFWDVLKEKCAEAGGEWAGGGFVEKIWAFGPHKAGGCLLIDSRQSGSSSASSSSLIAKLSRKTKVAADEGTVETERIIRDFDNHVETGFQLATFQGPLCAEPVEGLAYFVEQVDVDREALEKEMEQNRVAQVTGSVITSVRDACRNGLLDWSPRLMLAMYTCDIQASSESPDYFPLHLGR
jgi:ribosome assembly protein 1